MKERQRFLEHALCVQSVLSDLLLGKEHKVRLALTAFLAGGHLLIEDIPGVGKTTLAKGFAMALGLSFKRVQFTNDTLPSDITGISVYRKDTGKFAFIKGPVFTQVLLADEINRASPRTQSALLEAMEERQVTVDGVTHLLPRPFFVVATQNPMEHAGTYPLPDSQLDRFSMRISLGYPDPASEIKMLQRDRSVEKDIQSNILGPESCLSMQAASNKVHTSTKVLEYIQALIYHSRNINSFLTGLSPRAGLWLLRIAKAWAFLSGRKYLLPEDVQDVFPYVVSHRLRLKESLRGVDPDEVFEYFKGVACP